jgi:uncharacterized protein YndB with AHSA1/START domain
MPTSNARTSVEPSTADREIVLTRLVDAPRELVFEVWTKPEHVAQWWGPNGFSTTISEMDVRPGGVWRHVMHGPDGRDYVNNIVFLEVVRPERIVYKHQPEKGAEPVNHETTVTFVDRAGKTEVTLRMLFASPAAREHIVKTYGAIEGGKQTLGRLDAYLSQNGKALFVAEPGRPTVVVTRMFDAPRELVFEALTKPEHLSHWWGPRGFTLPVCENDVRPGGAYRFINRAPNGNEYPFKGVYREVVPPEKLVFTQRFDVEPFSRDEEVVTVALEEQNGKTMVTITELFQSVEHRDGKMKFGAKDGMLQSYDRLAELLGGLQ